MDAAKFPQRLAPDDPRAPKYWMFETSGMLAKVIRAYLGGGPMTPREVVIMRAYLCQWIGSPVWAETPALGELRRSVGRLATRADFDAWLGRALEENIEPL